MEIEKIILTDAEKEFLANYMKDRYNPLTASPGEQDIEIALIDKAVAFEEKYDLVDERIDFTPDCNILKWFYHRYQTQ